MNDAIEQGFRVCLVVTVDRNNKRMDISVFDAMHGAILNVSWKHYRMLSRFLLQICVSASPSIDAARTYSAS